MAAMNANNRRLDISPAGLDLIKSFEGFSATWYTCPAGKLTIGYGHVRRRTDHFAAPISADFALALLRQDVAVACNDVRIYAAVPLEQHQFDALVSFVFNLGVVNLRKSTLLSRLNDGDFDEAAHQFDRWVHVGRQVLPGLVRRRAAERAVFDRGEYPK